MTNKRSRKGIKDPNIPFLNVPRGYGISPLHNQVVAQLAALLHKAGYKVNYAHAKTTTPKDPSLPLFFSYKDLIGHAEITFELSKTHLVFIDILVLNKKYIKEVKEDGED